MASLSNISALAELRSQRDILTKRIGQLNQSATDWRGQKGDCSKYRSSKKATECSQDAAWKEGNARTAENSAKSLQLQVNGIDEQIVALNAIIASEAESNIILANKGLSQEALQQEAIGKADASRISAQLESEANAAATLKMADANAAATVRNVSQRNVFIGIAAAIALIILIMIIRKIRNSKKAKK